MYEDVSIFRRSAGGARVAETPVKSRVGCRWPWWLGDSGEQAGGRVAETPEELRKSGERRSGRRRREERRVSEGRYVDVERSEEGGVKGLS